MTLDDWTRLAAASASAAALSALMASGRATVNYALVALTALSCWENLAGMAHALTVEIYFGCEMALAILAAIVALEIGHESFRPIGLRERRELARVLRLASWNMVAFAVLAGAVMHLVPPGLRWGFRGLAAACGAAMAFVVSVRESLARAGRPAGRLGEAALAWLPAYLGVQMLYLASWELGKGVALVLAVPAATAQVAVMLSIAWASWPVRPRPGLESA